MHWTSIDFLFGSALFAAYGNAANLFVADPSGNLTTLSLTESGNGYNFSIVSRTLDCGPNPSWLTLDSTNRILYCLDRGASTSTSGSLNSFSIDTNGALTRVGRVDAPLSGVAGEVVVTPSGARGYVSASYNRSAAAVFGLGESGALSGTGPLQQIFPNISATGPVPSRQDASYLHHVILDPTGKYIVMPDLGGDRCRVYTYDNQNVAPIVEIGTLKAEPGSGPRHGFFRVNNKGETFFFFNGEIDQKVYSYRVKYQRTGLAFTKVFETTSLEKVFPSGTAPTSGIVMSPDQRFLVVSNRETSFRDSPQLGSSPSDTFSTFAIRENGTLKRVQEAPTGGWLPRQFEFNKAGDKIAVGHQNNQTVVIWKRDVKSGKIVGEAEGGKLAEIKLSGRVSATVWDE
ncbi:hypothetical protein FSARC_14323 [Fusarium sarcochroum]|uniref:3-carboxymuconate cyclase n=1 Tax=Fusarium sarcochroum TaxID=1208366 RepID=A0A8H4SU66_9HYPO|nr:hypothetical protein FSARC_14323 [Fusarium sarcochroum]